MSQSLLLSRRHVSSVNKTQRFIALSLTKKKRRKEQKKSIVNGKKSPYTRLGCRGDWPNIKPWGWDPSSDTGAHPSFSYVFLKQCSFVLFSIKPSNKRYKELSLSCH
ncbi:unnamed protein product [Brassica oleracea]|uniref:Uncharacterized protein n=1 Tax=Brassica oleracea var. oleracea TaxID=109376 RepID=A0A0D3A6A4_BRAOL